MSMFTKYATAEVQDNLSPFEKKLRERFLSNSNQMDVFHKAQLEINPQITFGNVVDSMYETFDHNLHDSPTTIEKLNNLSMFHMRRKHSISTKSQIRTADLHSRSNIPRNILPRRLFELQEDSRDNIVEFPNFRKF